MWCLKEFTQFFRSRTMVFLVLYMFAEIANCGAALTMDIRNLPLLVADYDRTSASRSLAERFRTTPYFDYRLDDGTADPDEVLQQGTAALVVVIPQGFARTLDRGEPASIQLLADGTYSNFAALALSYAGEIVERYSRQVRAESSVRTANLSVPAVILSQARIWYMPGLEYAHFTIVSMLSIATLIVGVVLVAALGGGLGWRSYHAAQAEEARFLRASGMLEATEVRLGSELGGYEPCRRKMGGNT